VVWLTVPLSGQGGAGPAAVTKTATAKASGKSYVVPKTPWGEPDLQGVWTSDGEAGVPFERPSQFANKEVLEGAELEQVLEQRDEQKAEAAPIFGGETGAGPTHWYENWAGKSARTSLVIDPPDGRVPALTPEARQRQQSAAAARRGRGAADSWEDRSLYDRCITRGMPAVMFPTIYNNNSRIVQGPGFVAITYEMIHETRVIPTDNRPFTTDGVRQYMGDARAHWEGDTLVVESKNFNSKVNYRGASDTLHLVERFERSGDKVLRYTVTVDDPHTFTRPWTAALNLTPTSELYEYGCHEGNYAMRNILSAARAEEKKASR
jgi:hypothetical protein